MSSTPVRTFFYTPLAVVLLREKPPNLPRTVMNMVNDKNFDALDFRLTPLKRYMLCGNRLLPVIE